MAIAHDASAAPQRKRWGSDNPIVRAVGRVPLPLGGKLLVGFAVVAALLAVVGALGLVSLNQSNSRGAELRNLQQTAAYAQLLEGDAKQLSTLVAQRAGSNAGATNAFNVESAALYQGLDNDVFSSWQLFVNDVQHPIISSGSAGPRH